jgi:hypothetical protein
MVAWGPGMDDWEVRLCIQTCFSRWKADDAYQAEERARKRMRLLLPQSVRPARSPSPPSLPHLRSPSPPPIGPYPPVTTQHPTYASFVLDKFNTHTFRSHQLDDLEKVTNSSIEAAAVLKKALGRLWQAISEDPDRLAQPTATATATDPETAQTLVPAPSLVPKEEPMDSEHGDPEDEAERERAERIARAPDLTPTTYKIFLSSYPPEDVSDSALAGMPIGGELEVLEKGLAALHEVQDDDREFVERLEEIRDGLGSIRNKRDTVWDIVRRKALAELQEAATVMS